MYYENVISDSRRYNHSKHDAGRSSCGRTVSRSSDMHELRQVNSRRSDRARKQAKRERSFTFNRIVCFLTLTLMIAFFSGISFGTILSNAETPEEKATDTYKYYKSVTIETGDSLWSIAEENMSEEYDSVQDYIDEVCSINHLDSSQIHAGCSLTVPYYSSEFK